MPGSGGSSPSPGSSTGAGTSPGTGVVPGTSPAPGTSAAPVAVSGTVVNVPASSPNKLMLAVLTALAIVVAVVLPPALGGWLRRRQAPGNRIDR